MKEMEAAAPPIPSRSKFVTRLSWVLIVITSVLALLSISAQITDFRNFDPTQAPGVRSARDAEILGNLNWALLFVMLMVWAFLLYVSWSLGRRRNWARKAAVVLFVVPLLWFSFIGLQLLLFTFGVMQLPFLDGGSPQPQVRVVLAEFTLVCFTMAYLCWRVFSKLRSTDVVREFEA